MADIVSVHRSRIQSGVSTFSAYLETRRATFACPWDVVLDPNLTCGEKKEILSDWACAARADVGLIEECVGTAGVAAWWHDLVEGLRLMNEEIAASSNPRTAKRPGHLKPAPRSRSSHAA